MKKVKKVLAIALSIALCFGLVGCSSKEPETSGSTETTNTEQSSNTDDASGSEKVSVTIATNWGEGDSKYDYFYPAFQEFQEENKAGSICYNSDGFQLG